MVSYTGESTEIRVSVRSSLDETCKGVVSNWTTRYHIKTRGWLGGEFSFYKQFICNFKQKQFLFLRNFPL